MPHEINRVLRAFGAQPWFIEPRKAAEIVGFLELRAQRGVRAEPYRDDPPSRPAVEERRGSVRIIRLYGAIMPRAEAVEDISQSAALMTDFMRALKAAGEDASVKSIVLDIDSPGGRVDLVPEAADLVWKYRERVTAVANAWCCSAAYWIASQAKHLAVTPSGEVGSIGVYTVHEDVSELLAASGVKVTYLFAGPRKVEGNPFEPLGDEARAHFLANVQEWYGMFVDAVARGRRVSADTVRADPEGGGRHFGGGRAYTAATAKKLGMVDSIETLDQVVARLTRPGFIGG